MNVVGTGTGPLSYQWYVGASGNTASPIGGATSNSYTTPPLTITTNYWVRVSNAYGTPADFGDRHDHDRHTPRDRHAAAEPDDRVRPDGDDDRRRHRHRTARLSVVRRRQREHGEPDRRRDVEQLHDAGALDHDELLGARVERLRRAGGFDDRDDHDRHTARDQHAAAEPDDRVRSDGDDDRRRDRHRTARLSVVRRRQPEHGEPDRRRDVEQLHDAGALEHDELLGARVERLRRAGQLGDGDDHDRHTARDQHAAAEPDDRVGSDGDDERRRHRHRTAQLSVVRRRQRQHGEPDRRRDVEQLHDAAALEHDELLGARVERVRRAGGFRDRDDHDRHTARDHDAAAEPDDRVGPDGDDERRRDRAPDRWAISGTSARAATPRARSEARRRRATRRRRSRARRATGCACRTPTGRRRTRTPPSSR